MSDKEIKLRCLEIATEIGVPESGTKQPSQHVLDIAKAYWTFISSVGC